MEKHFKRAIAIYIRKLGADHSKVMEVEWWLSRALNVKCIAEDLIYLRNEVSELFKNKRFREAVPKI